MKFKIYTHVFIGKSNEIHILIYEKSRREFSKYFGIHPGPKSNRDPEKLKTLVMILHRL